VRVEVLSVRERERERERERVAKVRGKKRMDRRRKVMARGRARSTLSLVGWWLMGATSMLRVPGRGRRLIVSLSLSKFRV
jgi:hypothetical protein